MIRTFKESDINAVAEIWLDSNIEAHSFITAAYWQKHFEAVKGMLLQSEIYVYEEAGRIKGFIGLESNYIAGIFVCAEARSKGIGKQLMNYVKERKSELSLRVYQKNTQAIRFYKREDFGIVREGTDENTNEAEYEMIWKK